LRLPSRPYLVEFPSVCTCHLVFFADNRCRIVIHVLSALSSGFQRERESFICKQTLPITAKPDKASVRKKSGAERIPKKYYFAIRARPTFDPIINNRRSGPSCFRWRSWFTMQLGPKILRLDVRVDDGIRAKRKTGGRDPNPAPGSTVCRHATGWVFGSVRERGRHSRGRYLRCCASEPSGAVTPAAGTPFRPTK
jgi:hypothetical protein